MKGFFRTLLTVIIVVAVVFLAVKYVHKCDDCENVYIGNGYKPNVITGFISEELEAICKECALEHHAVEITLGASVEDFKLK